MSGNAIYQLTNIIQKKNIVINVQTVFISNHKGNDSLNTNFCVKWSTFKLLAHMIGT